METQEENVALDIQDIDEFCKLAYDAKILYICAVHIKRNGNSVLKGMVENWLNKNDREFEAIFPGLYYKFIKTKEDWPNWKLKDVEKNLKNSNYENKEIFLEIKTLEQAVLLFNIRGSDIVL